MIDDNKKEIQKILFDLLCELVDFLDANNIDYMLCGGTLLGAIRHKGFIPWDDDIDIFIPRKDYDKLLNFVKNNIGINNHITYAYPGKKNYYYPFIKVFDMRYKVINPLFPNDGNEYAYIDIFPLDKYPDNKKKRHLFFYINKKLRFVALSKYINNNRIKTTKFRTFCKHFILKLLGGEQKIVVMLDSIARKMNYKNFNSKISGNGAWPTNVRDYLPWPSYDGRTEVIFCGRKFKAPKDPDLYLKTFYGDYMTLPPVEKRACHNLQICKN